MYEYLIGVGAMKAGTTLLYDLLFKHPQIRRGVCKELHYFDNTDQPDKNAYDGLFAPGTGVKLDVTPIYLYDSPCIDKIADTLGTGPVGVVVLLRDPVERALSHYNMRLSQGQEKRSFSQCFELEPARLAASEHDRRVYSYFERGLYAGQLDALYARFPRENVRVFLFEDFVRNQQAYVDEVCDFAGIDRIPVENLHSNKSIVHVKSARLARWMRLFSRIAPAWLRADWLRTLKHRLSAINEKKGVRDAIDPAFTQKLVQYYRADVLRLNREYGIDISKWKHFSSLTQ